MVKINTYLNEMPESRRVHPWTLMAYQGDASIVYGSLKLAEGCSRTYRREGEFDSQSIDVRVSLKNIYSVADGQYIEVCDGTKLLKVLIDSDGINLVGEPKRKLTVDEFNHIRLLKTAEGTVSLFINDDATPWQSVPYATLQASSLNHIEFKVTASITSFNSGALMLHYFNYAIGENADRYSGTKVDTEMKAMPHLQATSPWELVAGVSQDMMLNDGILIVKEGKYVSFQREVGLLTPTSDIDVLLRVNVHHNNGEFLVNIFDGQRGLPIRVEHKAPFGYRLVIGNELPIIIQPGYLYLRVIKVKDLAVKAFINGSSSPAVSIQYSALEASADNRIVMSAVTGLAVGSTVDVDFVNYAIDNSANETLFIPPIDKFMKINSDTGILEEHNPETSRTKFNALESAGVESEDSYTIKAKNGNVLINAAKSIGFRCNVGAMLQSLGTGEFIGDDVRVGSADDAQQYIMIGTPEDGCVKLPKINHQDPLSIVHALKLLSEFVSGSEKIYTAGEFIPRGKAVRFIGAQIVGVATCNNINDSKVLGIAAHDVQIGESLVILLPGATVSNVISGSAYNTTYFLDSTGGFSKNIPQTPGSVVIRLGYAENSTNVFIDIGEPRARR